MNYSIIITCVLVAIATSYMTGNARKNTAAARTPDGMRVLRNKRLGVVALVTMVAIGAGLMGHRRAGADLLERGGQLQLRSPEDLYRRRGRAEDHC